LWGNTANTIQSAFSHPNIGASSRAILLETVGQSFEPHSVVGGACLFTNYYHPKTLRLLHSRLGISSILMREGIIQLVGSTNILKAQGHIQRITLFFEE